MQISALACVAVLLGSELPAQWVKYPTPGTPRTQDGRPNLNAPAPRSSGDKPDLSGMWHAANNLPCDDVNRICTDLPVSPQFFNFGREVKGGLPFQPWAADLYKHRRDNLGTEDPTGWCVVGGVPRSTAVPYPFKILNTAGMVVIL